jgi:integrase/recombinase XerD
MEQHEMDKDFYNYDLNKRLICLRNSNISEVNKQLILNFVENCFMEGLGQHRILKYISTLKMIATQINTDFDKVEKRDLFIFISELEQSDKSEWLKHDYKVCIKKFYKWYLKDDNPELTKWIKASINRKDQKLPEEMLIEEDILKMINYAKKKSDKAIIALLWDIGARIGEIGNLRIKHIKFDEYGATVNLKGKTGYRRVRAVFSVEYLQAWLLEHPDRNNPDAPLWTTFDSKEDLIKPLHYGSIRMKIKRLAKKAGINKRIHPHLFRHSRCTYIANYLTEAQMNVYFGWIQGSEMSSVYVHLSGRDVDYAILKANGVIEKNVSTVDAQKATESPKLDLSLILEAKVGKLVEAKITELLGNSL